MLHFTDWLIVKNARAPNIALHIKCISKTITNTLVIFVVFTIYDWTNPTIIVIIEAAYTNRSIPALILNHYSNYRALRTVHFYLKYWPNTKYIKLIMNYKEVNVIKILSTTIDFKNTPAIPFANYIIKGAYPKYLVVFAIKIAKLPNDRRSQINVNNYYLSIDSNKLFFCCS